MNHRIPITVVLCRSGCFNVMFKWEVPGVNPQSPADGGGTDRSRDGEHVNAVCDSLGLRRPSRGFRDQRRRARALWTTMKRTPFEGLYNLQGALRSAWLCGAISREDPA